MQGSKRILAAAVVAAIGQITFSSSSALAVDRTWDGGAATDNLSLANNWVGDVLPAVGDRAIFTGTEGLNPIVDLPTQYLGLLFDAAAGSFTFGGTNQLVLGASPAVAGPITNNSAVTQTFNAPVGTYGGVVTNSVATGALVFNGVFTIGMGGAASGNNVFFTGVGTTTLDAGVAGSGVIATGGALVKQGAGTLIINGNAAAGFNPGNEVQGGILRVGAGSALGGGITRIVSGGGTLELQNNITVDSNLLMGGRANDATPHVRNFSGNNTINSISGTSGGGFHNFASAAGTLTIGNYIIDAAVPSPRTVTMAGAGDGVIQSWAPVNSTFAHNFLKNGTGTWTLGSGFNTTNGTIGNVTVGASGGTLVLDAGSGSRVTGNTLVNNGGTLRVVAGSGDSGEVGNAVAATTINIQQGGTFDASSFTNYSLQVGQTIIGGGTFRAGQLNTFGDNAIHIGNNATTSVGTFNVVGNLAISNEFATAAGGMRFNLAPTNTVGGGVNDLISINGDLVVNGAGGAIPLYVLPLTGALQTGTYRLIEFTSGSTPSASAFTIVGNTAGQTRQTLAVGTAAGQVNLIVSGTNANLVWKGDGGANNWDILGASNFLNGATPDKFYQFDNVTFNDTTTNRTVNLVGAIEPGSITVDTASTYTFQGSGNIQGGSTLTKSGSGTLVIANSTPNTFTGAININAGTLQVGIGGVEGSIGTGPLTNNGTLAFNLSVDSTPGLITGSGSVTKAGTGTVVYNQAHTYGGATTISQGRILLAAGGTLGDAVGGTTILAGADIYSTSTNIINDALTINGEGPAALAGAIRVGGAQVSTFNGAVTLGSSSTVRADGGAQAVFTNTVTGSNTTLTVVGDANGIVRFANAVSLGTGGFNKEGAATAIFEGTNHSWSGPTNINGGVLQLGNGAIAGDLPAASTLTIAAGGTLAFGSNAEITFNKSIVSAGGIAQAAGSGITHLTGDLSGFTGTLIALPSAAALLTNPQSVLDVATPTAATALTISDPASQGTGAGIIRLSNSQAVTAATTVLVQAQQANGIGRIELNNVNVNVGATTLHQRNNDFATIRSIAGNNSFTASSIVISTGGSNTIFESDAGTSFLLDGPITHVGGSARNILLQGAGTGRIAGVIGNNAANTIGINVTMRGTGVWTLSGANTTLGTNTVLSGTLVYGTQAQTPVFGTGAQGIDIRGGKAAFQYVTGGGAAMSETVRGILDAGFDQTADQFETGTIRSTTRVDGRVLGWRNNTALSQVEVAYTLLGDANLDFAVSFDDLLALSQNYGVASGKVWEQGDFNYDGGVTFDDLLTLSQNYNSSLSAAQASLVGASFAADFALAQSLVVVPEPAALSVLGLGLAGMARRRRPAMALKA